MNQSSILKKNWTASKIQQNTSNSGIRSKETSCKHHWQHLMAHPSKGNIHEMSKEFMQTALKDRPDILEALMPDWSPGCRRLTPGPGYLDACIQENVDYICTPIKCVHEDSIETVDGKIRKVDTIICATGFDV